MSRGGPRPAAQSRGCKLKILLTVVLTVCLGVGCQRQQVTPEPFSLVIGSFGHTSGRFNRPRGLAFNAAGDALFVVDWDGRIQKFDPQGAFRASWIMPDVIVGKPEDLVVTTNGTVLVADTHYSRIMEFNDRGDILRQFGSYGQGPGQFIYPVGICCDRQGNIYVSEYGENDRIQKFDSDGQWLAAWGTFGDAPGQFKRPSGIDCSDDDLIFVADAVNHRIQVLQTDGTLVRIIGREGEGPGSFRYPYDVAIDGDTLYVLEYGNQRVQRMSLDGAPQSMFGNPGRGPGQFASPWRCTVLDGVVYVSDTDNSRVVRLPETF